MTLLILKHKEISPLIWKIMRVVFILISESIGRSWQCNVGFRMSVAVWSAFYSALIEII